MTSKTFALRKADICSLVKRNWLYKMYSQLLSEEKRVNN